MRYFIFLFLFLFSSLTIADEVNWLLVDTQKKVLQVKKGELIVASFYGISIGRKGAKYKQKAGDDITPLGNYKITDMNDKSHFRSFFRLDYPSLYDAELALIDKRISVLEFQKIKQAHADNRLPPQDTVLGGHIGIHGIGQGNQDLQGVFDWTQGCVALSNRQIDQLTKWVYKGMLVQIK